MVYTTCATNCDGVDFFHLGSGVQGLKASDTGRGTSVILRTFNT